MFKLKALLYATLLLSLMAAAPSAVTAKTGDIIARLGPGREPTWSPDGTMIAFVDQHAVWVMNADGTGVRSKVADDLIDRFAWATDMNILLRKGKLRPSPKDTLHFSEVALTRNTTGKGGFPIVASAPRSLASTTGEPHRIFTGPWRLADGTVGYFDCLGSPMNPGHFRPISFASGDTTRWHHMRRVIALKEGEVYSSGFGDLWLMPIDSADGPGRRLTTGRNFQTVSTSPGCDRIAAYDTEKNRWAFFDSTGREVLPGLGGISPAAIDCLQGAAILIWAPNSAKCAFLGSIEKDEKEIGERLSVFNLVDGNLTLLLSSDDGITGMGTPSWSPSGDRLVVSTGSSGILVVEVK